MDPAHKGLIRTKESAQKQMELINRANVESQKSSLRTKYGIKENLNPLFQLNLDLYQ